LPETLGEALIMILPHDFPEDLKEKVSAGTHPLANDLLRQLAPYPAFFPMLATVFAHEEFGMRFAATDTLATMVNTLPTNYRAEALDVLWHEVKSGDDRHLQGLALLALAMGTFEFMTADQKKEMMDWLFAKDSGVNDKEIAVGELAVSILPFIHKY